MDQIKNSNIGKKMREKYFLITFLLITSLVFYNCSEVKEDIADPPVLEGVHSSSNLDSASSEFHGRLSDGNGFESCKKCHDANLTGGLTKVSCVECHTTINIHKEGIFIPTSPNFHGKYFADNNVEMTACEQCHGTDFNGGIASPGCTECHNTISIHKEGIFEPSSPNFHGKYFSSNSVKMSECKGCHGTEFNGGISSPSCVECHSVIDGHGIGMVSPESPNFHGKYLADNKIEMTACQDCHGTDFNGGISSPSCVDCHGAINVHQAGLLDSNSPNFHGKSLKNENLTLQECRQCHGSEYNGGLLSPSCSECHGTIDVHQTGLISPDSPNFHGKYLADNNVEMTTCMECHGNDYSGGMSSPSCVSCHEAINVHQDGILDINSQNFHGKYLKNTNWALEECNQCHGLDYAGGLVSSTCNSCHSGTNGPEACNTCHGDFSDPARIAPPKDLNDNTETTAKGVGAHTSHLYENTLSENLECSDCHPKVESSENYVKAHINGLPAEISLNSYNSSQLTCENNYCHGSFEFSKSNVESGYEYIHIAEAIVGENFSPKWTKVDGTQAACGTCHLLPPRGHLLEGTDPGAQTCSSNNCHPSAFNTDGSLNKNTHMNGKKDLN